jgi:hypothetical protein
MIGKMAWPAVEAILRLRDVGVPREALFDIAASAMDNWFLRGNPLERSAPELQRF